MGWPTFVNVLDHPSESVRRFDFSEISSDSQTSGNAANGLVEETRMAGPEAPHQVVHCEFEFLRVGYFDKALTLVLGSFGPTRTVECWIEIVL
jgi:hypothetical protein